MAHSPLAVRAMLGTTISQAIESYILYHDLAPDTAAWYRRIVSVFTVWAGRDVLVGEFNGAEISRLLIYKRSVGRSPHYVKSLRNGLVAILRDIRGDGPVERVRPVRPPPLEPESWTPQEVERLLGACATLPPPGRQKWIITIATGYYTGLDRCDLWLLERRHFWDDGSLAVRRRKTGSPVIVGVPLEVLAMMDCYCPRTGPMLHMGVTPEWFRIIFAGLVARAGLVGTFKKLRKSSGSQVERAQPGTGHKHLGNSRQIFERHYEDRSITRDTPTMPPAVKLPPW